MKKSIKPQIEELNSIYKHLSSMAIAIDDMKKAQMMPDFFNYLNTKDDGLLEQQNTRLKAKVERYEQMLEQIEQLVTQVINTLEGLKE